VLDNCDSLRLRVPCAVGVVFVLLMTALGLAPPSLHSSLQSTHLLCDDSLRAELGRVKQSRERRELVLSNELKRVNHRVEELKHRLRTVRKQLVASGRKAADLGELLSQRKAQKEANGAKHPSAMAVTDANAHLKQQQQQQTADVDSTEASTKVAQLQKSLKAQRDEEDAELVAATAKMTALIPSQQPTEDPITTLKQLLKAKDAELKEMKKNDTKHAAALTALQSQLDRAKREGGSEQSNTQLQKSKVKDLDDVWASLQSLKEDLDPSASSVGPTDSELAAERVQEHAARAKELLRKLREVARLGVWIVGDSTARRMYVRYIAKLEGITSEVLAEGMQNDMKYLDHQRQLQLQNKSFTNPTGETRNVYESSGYALRYEGRSTFAFVNSWLQKFEESQANVLYFGAPFLHNLYSPEWDTPICNSSFDLPQKVKFVVQALAASAFKTNKTVVVGLGNLYSQKDHTQARSLMRHPERANRNRNVCTACHHQPRCERFAQTNNGMSAANQILMDEVARFAQLKLVRMDLVTKAPGLYLGGGHWGGEVLDKKLEAFVNVMLDLKLSVPEPVTAPGTPIALLPAALGAGSPVKLPTLEGIKDLPTLARRGVWLVGDPGLRRVYVQYVAALEGIKDPVLLEGMQNNIGLMDSKHQRLLRGMGFTDDDGAIPDSYNRNGYKLNFMGTDGFGGDWFDTVEEAFEDDLASVLFFGVPFAQNLYSPMWNNRICEPSFDLEKEVRDTVEKLASLAAANNKIVLVGTATMYSLFDSTRSKRIIRHPERVPVERNLCTACHHQPRCEKFAQTNDGVSAANQILIDEVARFAQLKLVRMDLLTEGQPQEHYQGDGAWRGPVLEMELEALVTALQSKLRMMELEARVMELDSNSPAL